MNNNDKRNLYDILDEDEEMTDSDKRESYFSEIQNQEENENLYNENELFHPDDPAHN